MRAIEWYIFVYHNLIISFTTLDKSQIFKENKDDPKQLFATHTYATQYATHTMYCAIHRMCSVLSNQIIPYPIKIRM